MKNLLIASLLIVISMSAFAQHSSVEQRVRMCITFNTRSANLADYDCLDLGSAVTIEQLHDKGWEVKNIIPVSSCGSSTECITIGWILIIGMISKP